MKTARKLVLGVVITAVLGGVTLGGASFALYGGDDVELPANPCKDVTKKKQCRRVKRAADGTVPEEGEESFAVCYWTNSQCKVMAKYATLFSD